MTPGFLLHRTFVDSGFSHACGVLLYGDQLIWSAQQDADLGLSSTQFQAKEVDIHVPSTETVVGVYV